MYFFMTFEDLIRNLNYWISVDPRDVFFHISELLYSVIRIFRDIVNQFVPNDFIALLSFSALITAF